MLPLSDFRQLFRYGAVGISALGVNVGSFALMRWTGLALVTANVAACLFGAVVAYSGNYVWTFHHEASTWTRSSVRYATLWIFSVTLSSSAVLLIAYLGVVAGPTETAAKLCVEICIVVMNFVICKIWVFR